MSQRDERTDSDQRNLNEGDNQNTIRDSHVDGDIHQTNEIHQQNSTQREGTVIPDPDDKNSWIEFCEFIAGLPVAEEKLLAAVAGPGAISLLGFVFLLSPWNGFEFDPSQTGLLLGLGIVGAVLISLPYSYLVTDDEYRCPKCDERFALRPTETRKTHRTKRDSKPDIIHGERDLECRNCEYQDTEPDTWTPDELERR